MNLEKIGNFIALLRKNKGYTQAELAEKLDVSTNAISKWERGVCMPDVSKLDFVAEILGVSVMELIKGEKNNETQTNKITKKEIIFCINNFALSFKMKMVIFSSIFLIVFLILLLLLVTVYY